MTRAKVLKKPTLSSTNRITMRACRRSSAVVIGPISSSISDGAASSRSWVTAAREKKSRTLRENLR
ncbi:hypothetical protein QSG27_26730 [Azospirillum sp. C340-1]|uniref:Uncharacterized protein n=1 Tax=Azospirillum isscasi TaxID=3053926 RepID=A0ABU0WQ62_9PROT|nr:hypothetical protein [Azospirillum isscasi]